MSHPQTAPCLLSLATMTQKEKLRSEPLLCPPPHQTNFCSSLDPQYFLLHDPQRTAEQKAVDDQISIRMAAKLNYVANPRYVKKSRSYQRSLVTRVEEKERGYLMAPHPEHPSHHFSCSPFPLIFEEYEVGQPYEGIIAIRNVTVSVRHTNDSPAPPMLYER